MKTKIKLYTRKNNNQSKRLVVVKSQKELDDIPLDYKGRIYIEFGTWYDKAIVKNKYYLRVVAWGNSSVVAWENSSVEAWENSSVEAQGNVQVVDRLKKGKILISGNARKVYMPKNIFEFMDFYGIKHTKKKAIFYKAVRKENDKYYSNYDNSFIYEIGKTKKEKCDSDIEDDCSYGINISYLQWAIDFGRDWDNLAIIEVETKIENIVMPINTDGKVRTSEVKVIREIPLSECGLYGKIIEKRRNKNANQ